MNKKIVALRNEQRVQLAVARRSLKEFEFRADEAFKKLPENHTMADYSKKVMPWHQQANEVKREIEFLETELIEKKFANEMCYSDINPFEVIEEKTSTCYVIRPMIAVEKPEAVEARKKSFVPGGFCGHFDNSLQDWEITSDENATTMTIRRHKDGRWYNSSGSRFSISANPRKFYDYNF